jgi:hypothetical protein
MTRPFVIFSLPRSRSAWLSAFLSRPGAVTGHDIGITSDSPADFAQRLTADMAGTCETGAGFAWRLIRRLVPDVRFVVVLRPVSEVCASLARFGITGVEAEMQARMDCLQQIVRQPGTTTLDWTALRFERTCARLYQDCTGHTLDFMWWRTFEHLNIQVDMVQRLRLLQSRAESIATLKATVAQELEHA